MFNLCADAVSALWGPPGFRAYAKGRDEQDWREVKVFATRMRDLDSHWPAPFFRGTAIAWAASLIAVGEDFAVAVLREQMEGPASRQRPVEVVGGRLRNSSQRWAASGPIAPSWSEVLAHECGHTWQALRFGWLYLPLGAVFTLWREGDGWAHWFENQASEAGLFGGIVSGSVRPDLMKRATED
jgi:hypothetical protein